MTPVRTPLRTGMIGCGAIAEQHLRAVTSFGDVEVVGVCDLSPVTATWTAERFGTTAFTDHRELLARGLDVVHVLTPPSSHDALARDAVDAGAHVVVEKPITADADATRALLAYGTSAERLVVEHQNYRFNDGILDLSDLVRSGRLGTIAEIEVRIALDVTGDDRFANPSLPSPVRHLRGGVIRDYLPHECGLALALADAAGAAVDTPSRPINVRHAAWSLRSGIEPLGCDELHSVADVDGIAVQIRFSAATRPDGFRVLVRGSSGTAEVDLFQPFRQVEVARGPNVLSPLLNLIANGAGHVRNAGVGLGKKVLQHGSYHGVPRFLRAFYDSVATGSTPPISIEQIVATARFVDLLAASAPAADSKPSVVTS